ncbi:MAG: carbamoyltransferase HypF [Coriobacteriia bacterium]|nr:carbamoyltransferase HypF [Coriobacteriia bacterium]
MRALLLHVTGVVQGVGFRPFVYRLAVERGLAGWVRNTSEGVFAHVEGDEASVAAFPDAVRELAPPMAVVQSVASEEVSPEGYAAFAIERSESAPEAVTLVSPDIATCDACEAELFDPEDRRYRYPFVNCTNCGPRFTIIADIPYDRPATTMAGFEMCPACSTEYHEPADRRFHAQPDACPACGPRLYLQASPGLADPSSAGLPDPLPEDWRRDPEERPRRRDPGEERARTDALLAAAVGLLERGGVLALKGLGGFQLACDATSEEAVARLRERKRRWGKPLAVMVPDLETARRHCEVSPEEEELLGGTVRPIVLLRRRAGAPPLARGVAGILPEIGVMLPYTPLHHLLLAGADRPLVMTSGNLSEEPIAMENGEAITRLAPIADAFLLHDRGIHSRYDDSVVRVVAERPAMLRRARGYAPFPLPMPGPVPADLLAAGPEQKNTFCLVKSMGDDPAHAFVSQHIGDLENAETLEHFERTLGLYERLFRVSPAAVAHDLHPEYLSTKFAMALGLPKVGVQHHHAHVVSVTAEHGVSSRVPGIAFDGTGYGSDGGIWGGEVLLADWEDFERFAHLREVPMPGGAAVIRRPARMAIGLLAGLDPALLEHPGASALRSRLAEAEEATLLRMIERGVNSPRTSSMGRLFDAVAALAGVRDDALYEGQAAIELEAVMDPRAEGAYAFGVSSPGGPLLLDPLLVIEEVLNDLTDGTPSGTISARFHRAVRDACVHVAVAAAEASGTHIVALAGGVFMNRFLAETVPSALADEGLKPLTHRGLPFNDGAVSFGQAVVASARLHKL